MDPHSFRRGCAKFSTGVAIATVLDAERAPHGMTINSFTSVSLDPPLVLICVDRTGNMLERFEDCAHYGINVLRNSQAALSVRFAQRGLDRFDGIEWHSGMTGVPLFPESLARFECTVRQRIIAGDHTILIGEVIGCEISDGEPLIYFDSNYRRLAP